MGRNSRRIKASKKAANDAKTGLDKEHEDGELTDDDESFLDELNLNKKPSDEAQPPVVPAKVNIRGNPKKGATPLKVQPTIHETEDGEEKDEEGKGEESEENNAKEGTGEEGGSKKSDKAKKDDADPDDSGSDSDDSLSDSSDSEDDSDSDEDRETGNVSSASEKSSVSKGRKRKKKNSKKESAEKEAPLSKKKKKRIRQSLKVVRRDPKSFADMDVLIEIVEAAIKFEGFDPKITRDKFRDSKLTKEKRQKKLYFCFATYANIGNTIGKLDDRRHVQMVASEVRKIVNGWGIKPKKYDRTTLTLPRIALAFLPEYWVYRKFLLKEPQTQTESPIAGHCQDIVFSGCPGIYGMFGYAQYHKEFSALIYKREKGVDLEDKRFLRDLKAWHKVANDGFKKDARTNKGMPAALNEVNLNREQVLEYFDRAMTGDD